MLIRKKKTQKHQPANTAKAKKHDPSIGSFWVPGISDGAYLMPDWAKVRIEQDTDGVWRPVRQD